MSHNTTAKLPGIKDRGALIKAAEKLGCTVIVNGEAKLYRGNTAKGEVVLTHPKSRYDVALNKADGGVFEFTTDFFLGEVEQVYGKGFGKLVARYGAEVAKKIARLNGYQIKESVDQKTGAITHRVVMS